MVRTDAEGAVNYKVRGLHEKVQLDHRPKWEISHPLHSAGQFTESFSLVGVMTLLRSKE